MTVAERCQRRRGDACLRSRSPPSSRCSTSGSCLAIASSFPMRHAWRTVLYSFHAHVGHDQTLLRRCGRRAGGRCFGGCKGRSAGASPRPTANPPGTRSGDHDPMDGRRSWCEEHQSSVLGDRDVRPLTWYWRRVDEGDGAPARGPALQRPNPRPSWRDQADPLRARRNKLWPVGMFAEPRLLPASLSNPGKRS